MNKPKIIIADDHPLLMQGLHQYLQQHGYDVIATVGNGNDAYLEILRLNPEVAILDMDMPVMSGIEVATLIKQNQLTTKVIILTLYKQAAILREVGNKIAAYVTKDSALDELDMCIKRVNEGETYVSAKLQNLLGHENSDLGASELTVAELKILKLLKENITSADIADQLFISKRTVEKHRSNIIKKLNLGSGLNDLILWVKENEHLFN